MRISFVYGVAAGAGLLLTMQTAQAAEKVKWAKSFSAAMADAKKTNRLVMADFYTEWWGWCKRLDSDTYTDKKVVQLTGQVVPVKLDAEKEGRAAAQKYKVAGFPTILFLTASGEVAGKIGGYMPPGPFADTVQKIVQAHRELPRLEARYKTNPNDAAVAAQLAATYAGQGKQKQAEALLTRIEKAGPERAGGALPKAYNALADSYQEARQFDKAIPLFQKAVKTGRQPHDIAYAHISIAVCYLSQNKMKEGREALEATLAVPNCPPDLKKQAQQYLDVVKQRTNG